MYYVVYAHCYVDLILIIFINFIVASVKHQFPVCFDHVGLHQLVYTTELKQEAHVQPRQGQPDPEYETVMDCTTAIVDLEMTENVAYAPVHTRKTNKKH